MDRQTSNQRRMAREHASYRYLEALEDGDIDSIIDVLQQALYDASLEQMVLDTHQAYFQQEQPRQHTLAEQETRIDLPRLELTTTRSGASVSGRARRGSSRWMQMLAAVLILGVLLGGLLTLLNLRQAGPGGRITPPACQPYTWEQFPVTYQGTLIAVTDVSATEAWAVGSAGTGPEPGGIVAAIEQWNGRNWQELPDPVGDTQTDSSLLDVAAASPQDVWAVGYMSKGTINRLDESALDIDKTLIQHWDGSQWHTVPSPNGSAGNGALNALTVLSADNIWAVGTFGDAYSLLTYPLLEHWDGKSWQTIPLQDSSHTITGLSDITGTSSNDLWVTGTGLIKGDKLSQGVIGHWNGSQWQWLFAPANSTVMRTITQVSANDLWATGLNLRGPLLLHWNGQQWKSLALPAALATMQAIIISPVVLSANNILVAGNNFASGSVPFIWRWNGQTWQQIALPAWSVGQQGTINDLTVYAGQTWAVGSISTGQEGSDQQLILGERVCP